MNDATRKPPAYYQRYMTHLNANIYKLEAEVASLSRRLERQTAIATELRERNRTIHRKLQTFRMRAYTARQRAELWKHRAMRKDAT